MTDYSQPRRLIPALGPLYDNLSQYTYPLIRFVAGLWLMPHGAQKLFRLFGGNPEGTAQLFGKIGLSNAMALVYWVGTVEFFGGLFLAIGFLTRPVAVMVAILMAVAVLTVHLPKGFFWTSAGFEYPLMWGLLALAIAFKGGGRLSVDRAIGREF